MMRQSSSRNQRYKGGFRFRHFLQICLLLAICVWLVYQVKHSHDKKISFLARKGVEEQPFSFKFGRKDLPIIKENELVSETDMDVDDVEAREDEVVELEMNKEDAQYEEGRGDVDDWIDEQDQRDEENEREVEFKNEEESQTLAGEADSIDRLEHVNSSLDASDEKNKRDNVSRPVTHETHKTEPEAGHADSRSLDEEKSDKMDANLMGNSSKLAVHVSKKIYNSSNHGNLTGFTSNLSSIGLGGNTISETANHSMNGTSADKSESVFMDFKHENVSISSPISAKENNPNELLANSTTASLPVVTAIFTANVSGSFMKIANLSTVTDSLSYKDILENETASLIPVGQNHTLQNETLGENHSKLVDMVAEFDHKLESKTSEEQESEDQFTTVSSSRDEINLSHSAVTEEERDARTDLSTLPQIKNDIRHDYDETEE